LVGEILKKGAIRQIPEISNILRIKHITSGDEEGALKAS
jgi:hypothetical protein